jgi:hypothetical protein
VKRLVAGALLALGTLGGARAALRRRRAQQLRLDVYYEDGAMLSLPPTTPEATAALARATEALRAAEAA